MRPPLATFVRIVAILFGAASVLLILALSLWLAATGAEELEGLNGYHAVLGLCIATAAGLLSAEVILRGARGALRGRFFSRYVAVVFGACLGGAFTVLLPGLCVAIAVATMPGSISVIRGIGEALLPVAYFTLLGGPPA